MTNLLEAHNQWLTRPADERFPDLEALYEYVRTRKDNSEVRMLNLNGMKVGVTEDGKVALNGNGPFALLTHWGFNQVCSYAGAPAAYLRTLAPDIVKDCLNHALHQSSRQAMVLARTTPQNQQWAAALTGPKYGRIWDAEVVETLLDTIAKTSWRVPSAYATTNSSNSGLYASDRDMFAFFVNDDQPMEIGNAKLGKGFFIWNSETGAATFGLTTFLYNFVCGNHIVWGAEQVEELKIVHRLNAPTRFREQAIPLLNRFAESKQLTASVTEIVKRAMNKRVGDNLYDILNWFASKPFTKHEIMAGFQASQAEGDDPTTLWGMIQGLTAHARSNRYLDNRVNLERRVGMLLV